MMSYTPRSAADAVSPQPWWRSAWPLACAGAAMLALGGGVALGVLRHRHAGAAAHEAQDSAQLLVTGIRPTSDVATYSDTTLAAPSAALVGKRSSLRTVPGRAPITTAHSPVTSETLVPVSAPTPAVTEVATVRPALLPAGTTLTLRVSEQLCNVAIERNGLIAAEVTAGAPNGSGATSVLRIVGRTLSGETVTGLTLRGDKLVVDDLVYTLATEEASVPVQQVATGASAANNVGTGTVVGAVAGAILTHGSLKGTLAGAAVGAGAGTLAASVGKSPCVTKGATFTVRLARPSFEMEP